MEIVDAQVHVNRFMPNWQTANLDANTVIEATIAAMDAVGIDAVLIAETWGKNEGEHGTVLTNGVIRPDLHFSRRAEEKYPNRFGFLASFDLRDPDLDRLTAEVRQTPGGLCLRVIPWPQTGELDLFREGGFELLFAAAEEHRVPIFVAMPGQAPLLEPYLEKFPRLPLILDHCGVGVAPLPNSEIPAQLRPFVTPTLEDRLAELDYICGMAKYPNLAIKWCHAPARLSDEPYPHRDAVGHLRSVIDAYGAERVMWASDYTESRPQQTWAQSLHYLLYSDLLSETEKEWILGKSVRQTLRWSRP